MDPINGSPNDKALWIEDSEITNNDVTLRFVNRWNG